MDCWSIISIPLKMLSEKMSIILNFFLEHQSTNFRLQLFTRLVMGRATL